MIKRNAQQSLIANLIATPDHTSHLTKVRVSFVRKVNGKIKMDSQVVTVVERENTPIKLNKLSAKAVFPDHIQKYLEAQPALHAEINNMAQKMVPAIPATVKPAQH